MTNQQLILEDQLAAFGRLSFLVRWVSWSALAVSAVGVTAICWISVNGRRSDIGAMRALGARRDDVLLVFIAESLAPGVLGAAAGLAVGYLASRALQARLGQPAWFDWGSAEINALVCAGLFAAVITIASRRVMAIAPAAALAGA